MDARQHRVVEECLFDLLVRAVEELDASTGRRKLLQSLVLSAYEQERAGHIPAGRILRDFAGRIEVAETGTPPSFFRE